MFTVTIHQANDNTSTGTQVYSQTVDSLDLKAVIAAVNTPPPEPPKPKKKRSDAGKPRAAKVNTDYVSTAKPLLTP